MDHENAAPEPPQALPSDVVAVVDRLDETELRAVIDYAREREKYLHPTMTDQIETAPGEEILEVEERSGYTEVLKREPCGEDCGECPHGPYLYHVREQEGPDGETKLRWSYLGPVNE